MAATKRAEVWTTVSIAGEMSGEQREGQKTEIKSGPWRNFGLNASRHWAELGVGEEAPARPMDCQLRGPTRSTPHELFLMTLRAQRRPAATGKPESATARAMSRHSEIWTAQSGL